MKQKPNFAHLRLVNDASIRDVGVIIDDDACLLREEADRIEAEYGLNAYSGFLRKHGKRPGKDQAATIGRLLGGRVKADDGTMQPSLSKADKAALRDIKRRRQNWAEKYRQAHKLRQAVSFLAENNCEPEQALDAFQEIFRGVPLGEKFEAALHWLNRFAQELHRHEQDTRSPHPRLVARNNEQTAHERPNQF